MRLRAVGLIVALALLAPPLAAEAQPGGKVARVGYLHPGSRGTTRTQELLAEALGELGWHDGRNLVLERRHAEGRLERLPGLVDELVRLRVEVLVAVLNDAIAAAKRATTSIPIVMFAATDPVGVGFVVSLGRPGGNVTGTTSNMPEVTGGKALELLKEAVPGARRVVMLLEPGYPGMSAFVREASGGAQRLGLQLEQLEVRSPGELDMALARVRRARPDALHVLASGLIWARRQEIIAFAIEQKLPTMWPGIGQVAQEGGLMTYGFDLREMVRRTAAQVDKILKGAKPADLPVEQPTKFELVINLKTAKALGLTIPQSVLIRANEIIQ